VSVSILVLAAGRGTRLGGPVPKAYLPVKGEPLLCRSIRRLAALVGTQDNWEIVLAADPTDRAAHLEPLLPRLEELGLGQVVAGGATRQESMARALAASNGETELVLVHDAARPFFPLDAAAEAIQKARHVGAALLAVPVPDTVKQVDDEGRVSATVNRHGLWLAQTPQVMRRDLLEQALAAAENEGAMASDDVGLLERLGHPVAVVVGSSRNIKITTQADLELAELLAAAEDET
jgi:2-C-methyl-D-erythritol 4-phosphate cytidylyltransferase